MTQAQKNEIAARAWKHMYDSNFYHRTLENQRRFRDAILNIMEEFDLTEQLKDTV